MELTMEVKCFLCKREAKIGEEFYYFEPKGIEGHIELCKGCYNKALHEHRRKMEDSQ